ncbi:unnamed protein product [Orchesella dallaii]|uniref:Protein pelota homolog n=2 Tax=Orchesella dallaii TaxID=48710 RepID=A0ABP1QR44_9HEXA
MKVLGRSLDKDGHGFITIIPEENEDMWHAYNLITKGAIVRSSTFRKVQTESATGSSTSTKLRMTLTIEVDAIDFDLPSSVLRLKGRNIRENEWVKLGAYHTLDLEVNRKFTVSKTWDSVDLDRLEVASDPTQKADVGAVVMQEGLANICLLLSNMTLVRAKIEQSIPRKRHGMIGNHEKGLERFFDQVAQAVLRHINFDIVKCVLVASPGFVNEQFLQFMMEQAVKTENKAVLENKNKFLLVHASSGFKHSLKEVLSSPVVMEKLADTKAAGEVKVLETFTKMLETDPNKAFYGLKHVEKAQEEAQAVQVLMILDTVIRASDVPMRKRLVNLVESVKEAGGDVKIFSSLHVSGEQLGLLTGIAAILRFPMHHLEEDDDNEEDSDSSGNDGQVEKSD